MVRECLADRLSEALVMGNLVVEPTVEFHMVETRVCHLGELIELFHHNASRLRWTDSQLPATEVLPIPMTGMGSNCNAVVSRQSDCVTHQRVAASMTAAGDVDR